MYALATGGVPIPGGALFNVAKVQNSFESEVIASYFGITCLYLANL